jgi:hypothetical protein
LGENAANGPENVNEPLYVIKIARGKPIRKDATNGNDDRATPKTDQNPAKASHGKIVGKCNHN